MKHSTKKIRLASLVFIFLFVVTACGPAKPKNPDLILATTTSTQDSGLLDELVPVFQQESGYRVKVIAVGTGKALTMGREGNADVLLVHAPTSEKEFMTRIFQQLNVLETNTDKLLKLLKKDGWYEVARKGSHIQFKHANKKGRVTVSYHGKNTEIPPGTLNSILKQSALK